MAKEHPLTVFRKIMSDSEEYPRNMSQRDLASKLEISPGFVANIERGRVPLPKTVSIKLVKEFKCWIKPGTYELDEKRSEKKLALSAEDYVPRCATGEEWESYQALMKFDLSQESENQERMVVEASRFETCAEMEALIEDALRPGKGKSAIDESRLSIVREMPSLKRYSAKLYLEKLESDRDFERRPDGSESEDDNYEERFIERMQGCLIDNLLTEIRLNPIKLKTLSKDEKRLIDYIDEHMNGVGRSRPGDEFLRMFPDFDSSVEEELISKLHWITFKGSEEQIAILEGCMDEAQPCQIEKIDEIVELNGLVNRWDGTSLSYPDWKNALRICRNAISWGRYGSGNFRGLNK